MSEIDPTIPPENPGIYQRDQRKNFRAIDGRIGHLPNSDYATKPNIDTGPYTDRADTVAGRAVAIQSGKGLALAGNISLGNALLQRAAVNRVDVTASLSLTADKWAAHNGSLLVCNSATPITITVDDSAITGTAQGGNAGATFDQDGTELPSITLATGAPADVTDMLLAITSGTGSGQSNIPIVAYDNATKKAFIDQAWSTVPDATSVYDLTARSELFFSILQVGTGAVSIVGAGGLTVRGLSAGTGLQYSYSLVVQVGADLVVI